MANEIKPGQPQSNVLGTVNFYKARFNMYPINDAQLNTLKGGYTSGSFALFGIFLGGAVSLGPTAHALPAGDWLRPWLGISALFSGILAVIFGVVAAFQYWSCRNIIERDIRAHKLEERVEYVMTASVGGITPDENTTPQAPEPER
jgi:hypothetical protein